MSELGEVDEAWHRYVRLSQASERLYGESRGIDRARWVLVQDETPVSGAVLGNLLLRSVSMVRASRDADEWAKVAHAYWLDLKYPLSAARRKVADDA